MEKYYSKERNVQILVQLLKDNGIKRCIASPGTVNMSFVGSLQNDKWFEVYSCVDERSAAYMACGLAEETGEPVIITCTGATASRNYLSALTEAYYRRIPIIAVTATPPLMWNGHNMAQFIDRSVQQHDVCLNSYVLNTIKDKGDEWDCEIKVNRGLNEIRKKGGGPVHFNLVSENSKDFSSKEIMPVRNIVNYSYKDKIPSLPDGNIGIFIASHHKFSDELTKAVERFCYENDAVVLCDHTSGYYGDYKVLPAIMACQTLWKNLFIPFNLIIYIGDISGDYYTQNLVKQSSEVWRVCEDGQIRDPFQKVTKVFEMDELYFFQHVQSNAKCSCTLYESLSFITDQLRDSIPENLPFSNIWVSRTISNKMPQNAVCHLGILNTLRSWNFFPTRNDIRTYCNVGGFGIDGSVSSLIGASLCNKKQLYFGFFGDLAFFYDLNCLANRHVGDNVRIMLLNNGRGIEFRNATHPASLWGHEADMYFAAGGHFGNKSTTLVKNYAENLGFKYISASSKDEFLSVYEEFVGANESNKSIIFEVFLETEDEVNALSAIMNLIIDDSFKSKLRNVAHSLLSDSAIKVLRTLLSKFK